MDENYWDEISQNYTDEIFSVLENDHKGIINQFLKDYASNKKNVIDFGCGIGHVIPALAAHCRKVFAIDLSKKCLKIASEKYSHLNNVAYYKADIARQTIKIPKCEVAVAINSLIGPSLKKRVGMLKAIKKNLIKHGALLLIVPSLESFYFTTYKLIEWEMRDNGTVRSPERFAFGKAKDFSLSKTVQGIVPIRGVLTKHYLKEEIISLCNYVGFKVEKIDKMEYSWKTEFHQPPRWMKAPYPWDWSFTLIKR